MGLRKHPLCHCRNCSFPKMYLGNLKHCCWVCFIPKNLHNEFLYRFKLNKFNSPLYSCLTGEQNSKHLIMNCPLIDTVVKEEMKAYAILNSIHNLECNYGSNPFLISWSRQAKLRSICKQSTRILSYIISWSWVSIQFIPAKIYGYLQYMNYEHVSSNLIFNKNSVVTLPNTTRGKPGTILLACVKE